MGCIPKKLMHQAALLGESIKVRKDTVQENYTLYTVHVPQYRSHLDHLFNTCVNIGFTKSRNLYMASCDITCNFVNLIYSVLCCGLFIFYYLFFFLV